MEIKHITIIVILTTTSFVSGQIVSGICFVFVFKVLRKKNVLL